MNWLNYQHLYYFWHAAHFGSVTRASRELRLAQPTISAQIRTFEDVIGEKLFERAGRNLKLTEAGRTVYDYAEKIFSLGGELLDVLDGKTVAKQKEFKVGISEVIPKTLVYRIIKPLFNQPYDMKVLCLEDRVDKLLADLAVGAIDIVISDRPIPQSVKVKGYSRYLGSSSVSILGSSTYKRRLKKTFPDSLNGARMLVPSSESILHNELMHWLHRNDLTPRIVGTFQDTALMKIAARDQLGIIPIPTVIAGEVCREYGLEIIGTLAEVQEKIFIISLERKIKNPLIAEINQHGTHLFS